LFPELERDFTLAQFAGICLAAGAYWSYEFYDKG